MLNHSASQAMSTSVLEALPGKPDVKRREPGILYVVGHVVLLYSLDWTNAGTLHMSCAMCFPTMWHFDKCRLRLACAASF